MNAPGWWSSFLERRAARHEPPWQDEHLDSFRCRTWALVQQSKEQAREASAPAVRRARVRDLWRRLLRRDARQRRAEMRMCAERRVASAVKFGVVNSKDVPGVRHRSPDVGLVRPVVDDTNRVLNHMPRH